MTIKFRALRASALAVSALSALALICPIAAGTESPEGPIGKKSDPIIAGYPVTAAQQEELGLVTVGGACSGTLLNQFWVLTAEHCLNVGGAFGGMATPRPLSEMTITAAWRKGTLTPSRSVRYGGKGLDVALLFLSQGNFGKRNTRLIYHNVVDTSMSLTKFGRGYAGYAKIRRVGKWGPGQLDGLYRTAEFTPSAASETLITLPVNSANQVGAGGDSGGPDYVTGAGRVFLSIASVQSTCVPSGYAPGMPSVWRWATGITSCDSAALFTIRDDIVRVTKETAADFNIVPGRPGAEAMVSSSANCKAGFVWRVAQPEDLVCVTPDGRSRVARENADAGSHVDPAGAYGPNTCVAAYVWRNAFEGDAVCVTPEARSLVREENRLAASRRAGN